jgi:hypothetical protein
MKDYSLGRGRKKIVNKFTYGNGLLIVGLVCGLMIGMIALWILGYLNFEMH